MTRGRTRRTWTGGALIGATLALLLAAIATSSACLETLPAATRCDGAPAYAYCPPTGVRPGVTLPPPIPGSLDGAAPSPAPATRCTPTENVCLTQARSDCRCDEAACAAPASRCFPAPDCPPSATATNPGARCFEPTLEGANEADAGASPSELSCVCGCLACASTCDGKGPVLGGRQVIRLAIPADLRTERLGVVIRARGTGTITARAIASLGPGGPSLPASQGGRSLPVTSEGAFADLTDTFSAEGPPGIGISRVELVTTANAEVEIDCVVPFVVPTAK